MARRRTRSRRPIKSRRTRRSRRGPTFRKFKKSFSRRGRTASRVNISKAHVTTTREFIWGNFSINGTSLQFVKPDNIGGTINTTIPLISGTVALYGNGFGASFSINDLPAAELAVIRNFNFYKLDSVTLKFKPRWNNTGQDTNVFGLASGGPVLNGGGGAPRLYLHTQHDGNKVANESITGPDSILRYGTHTLYDLSGQRLYHIKPSTTNTMQISGGATSVTYQAPVFNKWMDTSNGAGSAGAEVKYNGLQMWAEWENPPLQASATGLVSTVVDVYATYTVSMKQLEA